MALIPTVLFSINGWWKPGHVFELAAEMKLVAESGKFCDFRKREFAFQ